MLGITWLNRPQNHMAVRVWWLKERVIVQKEEYFQVLSLGHPQTTVCTAYKCKEASNWEISSPFFFLVFKIFIPSAVS